MTSPYARDTLSKWMRARPQSISIAAALRRELDRREAEIARMLGIYAAGVFQAGWPLPVLYFTARGDMAGLGAPVPAGWRADLRVAAWA